MFAKSLGYSLKFHMPYHPQTAGQVERINLDIKRTLGKIYQETGSKWLEALSLALIKIRVLQIGDMDYPLLK